MHMHVSRTLARNDDRIKHGAAAVVALRRSADWADERWVGATAGFGAAANPEGTRRTSDRGACRLADFARDAAEVVE
jgi:hypothetical protein